MSHLEMSMGSTVYSLSTSHALWFHRMSLLDRWHVLDVDPVSVANTQGLRRGVAPRRDGASGGADRPGCVYPPMSAVHQTPRDQ